MTYPDPTERAAIIGGFRALADYLESNPEVPAPVYPVVYAFPSAADWPAKRVAIDVIAEQLAVTVHETSGGHYVAARFFGPLEYRAVAIPRRDNESE
jgi:hypothetical protein